MSEKRHNVALRIGGKTIEKWAEYSIDCDMLTPADAFRLSLPGASPEVYALARPDAQVDLLLDDTQLLSGFIDDRDRMVNRDGGVSLQVTGRDRASRLVDESMDLGTIRGLFVKPFVEKVIQPWFGDVTFSHAENRKKLRGKGAKLAKVVKEPGDPNSANRVIWEAWAHPEDATKVSRARKLLQSRIDAAPAFVDADNARKELAKIGTEQGREEGLRQLKGHAGKGAACDVKVSPGQSRWQILSSYLEEIGFLGWSTNDGIKFFVGLPNYDQAPQYHFFQPKHGSNRQNEGNVISLRIHDSTAERYSKITVMGTGRGDAETYGKATRFSATVEDPTDFSIRKQLIVHEGRLRGRKDALEKAQREKAERDAHGRVFEITVRGHSQSTDGGKTSALYAFDTVAIVEDEEIGLLEPCLITSVNFTCSRDAGELTNLRLVPKGTVLKP